MVPEPREVMVGNKRLKRKQKAGLFIAQDRHFATASTSLGSPDVLAVDDPDDPPPTDIGSDIPSSHFHGRRGRPISHVELPSKRQRRGSITIEDIQDSEDELAHTGPGVGATVNLKRRRLTNFDSIQTREGKRHSIPNTDIIPTDFRSPKKSDDQRKASQVFNLIGAITGKQIWESSSYEQAALVLEGTKFFRFFVNGQLVKESPFEIELNTIRKLNHAMTDSPFVALQRRSSFGQSPQMYLHFETQLDATRFMQCISFGQSSVQESDP